MPQHLQALKKNVKQKPNKSQKLFFNFMLPFAKRKVGAL